MVLRDLASDSGRRAKGGRHRREVLSGAKTCFDALLALRHGATMRSPVIALALLSGLLATACQTGAEVKPAVAVADTVFTGGRVWTGVPGTPWASAIAVKDGAIVAVGDNATVAPFTGPTTRVVPLAGRLLTPAFRDGHVHPLGGGRQELGCSLAGLKTVEAILAKVKVCADAKPEADAIIYGRGWDLSLFKDANPNKALLDEVVSDRFAYFRGEDGHSGWANSKALAMAGITKDTKNPVEGVIERGPDGLPSGTVRESAIDLLEKLIPEPTVADDVKALELAFAHHTSFGITSIMDAGVDERRLETYRVYAEGHGDLPVRLVTCTIVDAKDVDVSMARARDFRKKASTIAGVDGSCVKIYLDGVLEGETAALLSPYVDHPEHSGTLNADPEVLKAVVTQLEADGFQVHMHVIGDRAVRVALDAYEASLKVNGPQDRRGTLAHLQLVGPDDYARFGALGVVVNAQSLWAYPDTYIVDINTPQVGQARVDRMYPWGSLQRAGARVVGGSDWPVSSLNPLDAIEVMVTRRNPHTNEGPVLNADEALSLDDAVAAYTREAAFLLREGPLDGTIQVGAVADVAVFDVDFFAGGPGGISDAKVVMTMRRGAFLSDPESPAVPVAMLR